jgi:hypothetical protein
VISLCVNLCDLLDFSRLPLHPSAFVIIRPLKKGSPDWREALSSISRAEHLIRDGDECNFVPICSSALNPPSMNQQPRTHSARKLQMRQAEHPRAV